MSTYIVYIDDLKPGMIVGSPVLGKDKIILIKQGVILTEKLILSLKKHKILQINILFKDSLPGELPSLLSNNLEKEGRLKLESVIAPVEGRVNLSNSGISALSYILDRVIEELFDGGTLLVEKLKTISDDDSVTYDHSWSVAVLSLALLKEAKDSQWLPSVCYQDVVNIGMGALLHDIGKLCIPPLILNKPGPLNEEEWSIMKSHPSLGLEIARKQPNVMPMARGIIIHHHQRLDGRGYGPLEEKNILCGDKIPKIIRLVTVADIYDALSTERSYKPAFIPWSALNIMRNLVGTAIDPFAFELLERIVVPFPSGSFLLTNNSEICVVTSSGVTKGQRDKRRSPSVKVIANLNNIKGSIPGDVLRLEPATVLLGAITLRGLSWRVNRELSDISKNLLNIMDPSKWFIMTDWKDQILSAFPVKAEDSLDVF